MSSVYRPTLLFEASVLDRLRAAAETCFSIDGIHEEIGVVGQVALNRSDIAGVERVLTDTRTASFIRLFLLGMPVQLRAAAAALSPLRPADAIAAGLLVADGETVRASVDFRPYAEVGGDGWWVMSDPSTDIRAGELDPDHVLGIGAAATTLAQAVIRDPVAAAADIGTGCGVQAMHLSGHAEQVIATDVSVRALRMAAVNARLNDMSWDLRLGSLLDPLNRQAVDLLVCNPPFIVGPGFAPGSGGLVYRDSGLSGDDVSSQLVSAIARTLAVGGTGQLLANWVITGSQPWEERVEGWLTGSGCDAWVWQREVLEPGEYVNQWLRDAGNQPGTASWRLRYQHWMDWFSSAGVAAVGMGMVSIRRTESSCATVLCEDLRQAVEQPVGPVIAAWFDSARWLRDHDDRQLLASTLQAADGLVLDSRSGLGGSGWRAPNLLLTQTRGVRWQIEADEAVAALVAGCDGTVPMTVLMDILGITPGSEDPERLAAVAAVIRDLVQRGFLTPSR